MPEPLQGIIGKKEIWRSLGTDSPTVAKRRALRVAAQIEHEFEIARSKVGLNVDPIMLEAFTEPAPFAAAPIVEPEVPTGITLGDLYCPSSKHLAQVWRGVNGERASSGVGF